MTVQSAISRADYDGNGVTPDFAVPFRFLDKTHLRVIRSVIATGAETELVLDSGGADGFTVTGAGSASGGEVTVVTPPAGAGPAQERITILRNVPATQLLDFITNDAFPAESHERALDLLTMLHGQQGEILDRAMVLPASVTGVSAALPVPEALAPLVWNEDGTGIENGSTTQAGDLLLRGHLASSDADKGGFLVRFIQSGVDAIARWFTDKLRAAHLSVEDFGAVGDGVTNDYAAIVAAITEAQARGAGTVVHFENANYALGSVLVLQNTPVILRGKGGKHPAYNGAPAATGTSLKYTGASATGSYFVTCQHMIGLHGLQGISLDCDSKVRGLDIADVYYGEYRDVSIRNMASGTVAMRTGLSALGSTNWNTFDRFSIDAIGAGGKGLYVTGSGVQNTAHNVFRDIQINYSGGATGLHLGYSDNNSFHMVFINRVDGVAGKGVYADPSEDPLFPESNYFFHLQAGQDGWQQPNNTPRNYIYGYDRSNGQPLPSLGATNSLLFFTEGANLWMGSQKFVKDDDAWAVSTSITVTANSGAITTVGAKSCRYFVRGKTVHYHINATITTNGTGASYINIGNLPFTPGGTAGFIYMATGRQVGGTSSTCYGTLTQGSTTMTVLKYDATYPGGDGITLCLSGQVETN